jgi:hypothetical protein
MGRSLWSIHSVWATVLDEWQRANDDQDYWRNIDFDKLAHAVHLIWNGLYDPLKKVSFCSPYRSSPGIHGPGSAVSAKGDRPVYALDFIAHIQETLEGNPDICLFALSKSMWQGRKTYSVKPGKPQAWLLGQQAHVTKSAFEDSDKAYLKAVSRIFSRMTKEEIRVIGTHQSREKTLEAIEFNIYIHLFQKVMIELEDLQSGMGTKSGDSLIRKSKIPSLPYIVDEIKRKAFGNVEPYSLAREKIDKACSDNETEEVREVASLAKDIFHDPKDIWGVVHEVNDEGGIMSKWKTLAGELKNLINYMNALHVVIGRPRESRNEKDEAASQERAKRVYEKGAKSIHDIHRRFNVSLPPLPCKADEPFAWDRLRSSIIEIFNSLPGITKYYRIYRAKVINM